MSNQTSQAKQEANRANAQLSTGPTSEGGKAKVSLNAVRTGLTGRTVLLPTDDVAAYEALIADVQAKWQPATPEEERFTQALADAEWRLMRIPELEAGIYALGYRALANEFADIEDPAARRSAIHTQIFLTHTRQLNNLGIQESRLRRQREKDTASLQQLQAARKAAAMKMLTEAALAYIDAVREKTSGDWEPEAFGFEFTMDHVQRRALELQPDLFDEWHQEYGTHAA